MQEAQPVVNQGKPVAIDPRVAQAVSKMMNKDVSGVAPSTLTPGKEAIEFAAKASVVYRDQFDGDKALTAQAVSLTARQSEAELISYKTARRDEGASVSDKQAAERVLPSIPTWAEQEAGKPRALSRLVKEAKTSLGIDPAQKPEAPAVSITQDTDKPEKPGTQAKAEKPVADPAATKRKQPAHESVSLDKKDMETSENASGHKVYKSKVLRRTVMIDRDDKIDVMRASAAKAAIEIVQEKGWDRIKVTGDDKVRRAVWLQGETKGVQVRGYDPTAKDLKTLAAHKAQDKSATLEKDKGVER